MRRQLPTAVIMVFLLTALTGLLYPLAVTGIAQLVFPSQANGSLIERDGVVVGSSLLGQEFIQPGYFHPRPSAVGYDSSDSGGANLGPSNPVLLQQVAERVAAYRAENGLPAAAEVPVDAVTASASGLDPQISVANAELQAPRVAEARGLSREQVLALIATHTTPRAAGFLGEPGVNVLELNLDLDELAG
ncbi:MAG: K(+)-transporting ATPase subunit C [Propionibacteriaceae bacterium]|nr:K(+)-transporting ATPase subunit C [Propionibacteriaceae bacterium]